MTAQTESKTHRLKTHPEPFFHLAAGDKPFEMREADRDFQVGDVLHLDEYDPDVPCYSGNWIEFRVTYILDGRTVAFRGIPTGNYVVMGLDRDDLPQSLNQPFLHQPDGD